MLLLLLLTALGATPAELAGTWSGTLGGQLPLVVHLSVADGAIAGTLDSPAQGALGLPLSVTLDGDVLRLVFAPGNAEFEGRLVDGEIRGVWRQGGEQPLVLTRGEPAPLERPQTPQPPFPYTAEDVAFDSLAAGVRLAGTLTLPPGEGPFTAVVLVSGSGPQDRDETLAGHKPFAVLADQLTRAGIAVLRYDDRGFGQSTGDLTTATTADNAVDAAAAVRWLAARPEIADDRVGIVGHSEGGLVAPMVAAGACALPGGEPVTAPVAFVVLLAAPAVPGDLLVLDQAERIAAAEGLPAERRAAGREARARLFEAVLAGPEVTELAELRRLAAELLRVDSDTVEEDTVTDLVQKVTSPWMRYYLGLDPRPLLARVACPVLAVYGGLDLQVAPSLNAPAMVAALGVGPEAGYTVTVLPGLNHLFQHTTSGSPAEYGLLTETLAPEVTALVADWVTRWVGR